MTESKKAVFLSYASQDAESERRIAGALRAAGVEVWFDQSELRGGDVWDQKIRKQIHECALFIPIISAHTQARTEGYFRLEWHLADQRKLLMTKTRPFLVPVCIDGTADADAEVPDSFAAVQWTRLPAGETPPTFVERVSRLLSPEPAHSPPEIRSPAAAASHAAATPRQPASGPTGSRPTHRLLLVIAAVTVIAVGYIAVNKFVLSRRGADAERVARIGQPVALTIPEKSIAVLPFADMSEKKDQEYFSDGLSEELIDLLTKVPDLRVPARTSSFFFKGKQVKIAEIAKELGVSHVLEGSVRKAGNTIRVTAQLIRADNGYHLWSETYDRDLKDIFKVQDEIAGAVVSELKLKLARGKQTITSHRTSNIEAYNQYLIGRQFSLRGNEQDDFRRAIEAYQKAIQLDPTFAVAYAGLAKSGLDYAGYIGNLAGKQKALAMAEKAVALAPEEADGYAARGYVRASFGWDWIGAQSDFEKALAIDSGNSTLRWQYARLLDGLGRLREAIAATKKATELDPLDPYAWSLLGYYLIVNQQFPAAHEALRRSLEIQPQYSFALNNLGLLQLLEDKAVEALATSRQVGRDDFRLSGIAMAEHKLGHAKESQQALDKLIAKHAQDSAYDIAEVYAWRGEKEKAFEWLEQAYQQREADLFTFTTDDPLLTSLHGDARFSAMLRKMRLPE